MNNDKAVLTDFDNNMSLETAYMELGKAYYEGGFEDPLPQLLPLFDKITRLKNQTENIDQQDVVRFCVNCGAELDADAVFCGNCGYRIK